MTIKAPENHSPLPPARLAEGRTRPKTKPQKSSPDNPLDLAYLAAAAALDKKASDLSILAVANLTDYTDYFLLTSASSTRQASAIATNICTVLKKAGVKPLSVSGINEGQWALLDFGAVVIHIFHQPVREYYDLESIWIDAPKENIDEKQLSRLLPPKAAAGANKNKTSKKPH
jgi:ribosome-associated protein